MNECYCMGNLGRDPVVKCTQTGKTYARFSIGCSEKWGDKEITNWVNVVCWDNVAQAVFLSCLCGSQLPCPES